jgi:GNAT superfamily N-acetyltransferase
VLQSNLFAAESAAIQLFTEAGFSQVREWLHLVVELTAPPPPPVLPEGLLIRPMDLENDWDVVGPTMDAAFANHWGAIALPAPESAAEPEEEAELPTDDSYSNAPGYCFIALDGATVAGGVLCNAKLVERTDTGRVGSLFVHPAYQRQGIGRALMHTAFGAFWQTGVRRLILDTDAESFSATPKFYASLGMNLYRREWLYEKTIRPGREVRCLTG